MAAWHVVKSLCHGMNSPTISVACPQLRHSTFCVCLCCRCSAGLFAMERGSNCEHLHFQGVVRLYSKSPSSLTNELYRVLGWKDSRAKWTEGNSAGEYCLIWSLTLQHSGLLLCLNDSAATAAGHCRIHSKELTYEKLHSFVGMLGYCTKDASKEHYVVVMTANITEAMLEAGKHCTRLELQCTVACHVYKFWKANFALWGLLLCCLKNPLSHCHAPTDTK
jgi:hypothetical protein